MPKYKKLKYPVVLVHGFMGFDEIGITGYKKSYFKGVAREIEKHGVKVYKIKLPAVASVKERAARLAEQIKVLPEDRFNIIAHSMGGVDARYAITKLGLCKRTASLTTISSPHHGIVLAEKIYGLLNKLKINVDALNDLSEKSMEHFNKIIKDKPNIDYLCVTASVPSVIAAGVLALNYIFLLKKAGENDGIVPTASQLWGKQIMHIEAHHWAQIGWSRNFDAASIYLEIIDELKEMEN